MISDSCFSPKIQSWNHLEQTPMWLWSPIFLAQSLFWRPLWAQMLVRGSGMMKCKQTQIFSTKYLHWFVRLSTKLVDDWSIAVNYSKIIKITSITFLNLSYKLSLFCICSHFAQTEQIQCITFQGSAKLMGTFLERDYIWAFWAL